MVGLNDGTNSQNPWPTRAPENSLIDLPTRRTVAEWREVILEDLGGEGVDPDLNEKQLDSALRRALELWNKHRPLTTWFPFEVPTVSSGAENGFRIDFFGSEAMVDNRKYPTGFIRNVLNVTFIDRDHRVTGKRTGAGDSFFTRWGYQGPRLFFEMQVGERTYERMTGTRPDWRWDPSSRSLFLAAPSRDVLIMVLASRDRRLTEICYDRLIDFRRLAVASAKRTLARVLGSRGPVPGPAGNIETDARELRQEAKEEWDKIEESLQVSLSSNPPAGYIG